ncbi:DUF559 domain-containing protein [Leucobacter viscericola]|uniref:DUF559 domain-containing protein n=1 Tax=Leucobacter viscericola TaxID=2714935 RepID=A0A6G7XC38_9MICO|nr:DUF559 domain-containing protein [Leucobacter viscericola]QIK62170.1 DUF559 domain-containing protein [Leucobacter viscericola]
MVAIRNLLRECGGIERTTRLRERGVTRAELDQAIAAKAIVQPQRGWIALTDADSLLVQAAKDHVVLSCVTQAKRLGLWVRETPKNVHVAPPGRGAKVRNKRLIVHWRSPPMLRSPFLLEDPIENVLNHLAECQPREDALVIWESALNKRMTDYSSLATLPLNGAARRLLEVCTPFSDSGLESLVCSRLSWLPCPISQQSFVLGHRVDVLIGQRLVLQIDGATHTGAQRTEDIKHDAELKLRGYEVIRVSYEQVMFRWEEVERQILGAIARGKHLAR